MPSDIYVIVTAYNEAPRIGATLRALALAFPGAPLWVADDGSTDATPEIAREAGARVVRSERMIGKGRRRHARGPRCSAKRFDARACVRARCQSKEQSDPRGQRGRWRRDSRRPGGRRRRDPRGRRADLHPLRRRPRRVRGQPGRARGCGATRRHGHGGRGLRHARRRWGRPRGRLRALGDPPAVWSFAARADLRTAGLARRARSRTSCRSRPASAWRSG